MQSPALHQESRQAHRQSMGAEESEMAKEEKEKESVTEASPSLPEVGSGSSENEYDDDLYVFIPGDNPENNSQEPIISRPPLPLPRPGTTAFQLEKPHFMLQGKFKVKTPTGKKKML